MQDEGGGASRTTDPASGTSSATDVSLREYLTSLIAATERRSDERFEHMKQMVEAAFEGAQTAITKADAATEKRFESVNEFRAAMADQAQHFATREALEGLSEKLTAEISRNREDLLALARRIDIRDGQTLGSRLTGGVLVTVITVGVSLLVALVVIAQYFASK